LHDAEIINPYWTCSLEEGLASKDLFTPRTIESIKMFVKRLKPVMLAREARRIHRTSLPIPSENLNQPVNDYRTLNGDGLISVCIRVNDEARHHVIATYDHITEELKQLGTIPRHRFIMSVDASVFCMDDPKYVEGVIGAMTHDAQFVAIFAHSKNLRVVSVFNIPNAVCLFEKNLSQSEFFQDCQPTGVALVPTGVSKTQFNIAVLSHNMEVRVWNTGNYMGRIVKLEGARSSFGLGLGVINHRESFLKFSPDGRYLCVLALVDSMYMCIVMDAISLEALYKMPYDFTYGHLCCIFPCFTMCASRFVMFTPKEENYYDVASYQLHFFEIPQTVKCLKDLCRLSILRVVNWSNLSKLSLPQDLILFLTGSDHSIPVSDNLQKNQCHLM
jgi:hypothetical protein